MNGVSTTNLNACQLLHRFKVRNLVIFIFVYFYLRIKKIRKIWSIFAIANAARRLLTHDFRFVSGCFWIKNYLLLTLPGETTDADDNENTMTAIFSLFSLNASKWKVFVQRRLCESMQTQFVWQLNAASAPSLFATNTLKCLLWDNDSGDNDDEEQQQQLVCCGFSLGKGGEIIEIRNNVHKSNEIATKALPEN